MNGPPISKEMQERLDREQPCDENGIWWEDVHGRVAWTPRGFIRRGDRYLLTCPNGHEREAPLQTIVDAGRGDKPMHTFTWKCATCGAIGAKVALEMRSKPP